MKKLVPDPPPVLCVRAGLAHEKALSLAQQHIETAITIAHEVAERAPEGQRERIGDVVLQIQIIRALLKSSVATMAVVV